MAVKSDSGESAARAENLTEMYYSKRELTTSSYWSTGRPTDDEYLTEEVYLVLDTITWATGHLSTAPCDSLLYHLLQSFFSDSSLFLSITTLLLSIRSCSVDKIKLAWLI